MIPQSRGPPLDTNDLNSTNRLLRVIIALLLRGKDEQNPSLKRQIEILADLSLRPAEIAEILGRSSSHINKELSGLRKGRREER
jgi:hypothetical protein